MMWGGMMAWMLIFWVVVVVLAIWLAAWLFPSAAAPRASAREVLDLRYARGELTQDQYRQMRQELTPLRTSPGRRGVLAVVLLLIVLVLLAILSPWGMHGPWGAPWYGHPGVPGWRP